MRRPWNKFFATVLSAAIILGSQPIHTNASQLAEDTQMFSEDVVLNQEEIETTEEVTTEEETETTEEMTTEEETKTTEEVTTEETETTEEVTTEEETETTEEVTTEETETTEEMTTEEETEIAEEAVALSYGLERSRSNAESVFQEADFIKADGKNLRNQAGKGELINLRGTNAGGYLLQEFWMTPTVNTSDINAEIDIYRYLKDKYGEAELYQLMEIYQQSYWTEEDFDRCKELGMNVIRLPFWYRNLVDEQGEFYGYDESADDPYAEAFATMDWFVAEANAREIYVIIDFHGAPGSQNGSDHSGVDGKDNKEEASEFFFGEKAKENQKLYYKIWKVIAERYQGNPGVAGYDLLNEPYCTYRYDSKLTSSEDELRSMLWEIYDKAYDTIRSVDEDHVIIMEATWNPVDLPNPVSYGWENVMYEYHNYLYDDYDNAAGGQISNMESKLQAIAEADYNVPSYLGEFSYFNKVETWDEGLDLLNESGINWTTWTYKTIESYGNWGLYHHVPEFNNGINLETASLEEIKEWYARMDEIQPNEDLIEVVSSHFKEPVVANNMKPEYFLVEEGEYYLSTMEKGQIVEETEYGLAATTVSLPNDTESYMWKLVINEDDTVSLQQTGTGCYVSVHDEDKKLYADASTITDAEKFYFIKINYTQVALKSKSEQFFVTTNQNQTNTLQAVAQTLDGAEVFYLYSREGNKVGDDQLPLHSGWTRYEAEKAQIVGDGTRTEEQEFYSGKLAVTGLNNACGEQAVEEKLKNVKHVDFTVVVEDAGEYELVINYNGDDDKVIACQVNDNPVEILMVERQAGGQWDALLEKYVRVNLVAGENHIRLSGVLNDTGWMNFDCIDLCDSPVNEKNGIKRFEGEHYFHTGKVETQTFYSSGKGVGELNSDTGLTDVLPDWSNVQYVTFTLYSPEEASYTARWGYNGNGADGMKALYQLNNQEAQTLTLNNRGASWDKMNFVEFDITLQKGFNSLKLSGTLEDKANWANIDYLELGTQGAAENYSGYTIYEAEKANIHGASVEVQDFYSGKKGVGSLVNEGANAKDADADWSNYRYVEFVVNVPVAGEYPLFVTYNGDDDKEILLRVNHQEQKIIEVPTVSADRAWNQMHEFYEVVMLEAGENKIALTGAMGQGWINYDYIQLANYPVVTTDAEKGTLRLETEHFDFSSTKSVQQAIEAQDFYSAGYGVGGVGGVVSMVEGADIKTAGASWIAYTVYVLQEGKYEFTVAMNGNGADIKAAYQIDGSPSYFFTLPNAGKQWNEMSYGTFQVELTKGYHEVLISGGLSETWDDWVNYDYIEMTLVEENIPDDSDTSAGTQETIKPSSTEPTRTTSSKSDATVSSTVQIMPQGVPLAANIDETLLPFVNISFQNTEARLKQELLQKYYGRNIYLLAHLGNGVGFSMDLSAMTEVSWKELNLGTSMEQMENFAEGFATFCIKPYQKKNLASSIGVHVNVGKDYMGKTAYMFLYEPLTASYQLSKITTVNDIGNVAVYTDELTDIVVLVQE